LTPKDENLINGLRSLETSESDGYFQFRTTWRQDEQSFCKSILAVGASPGDDLDERMRRDESNYPNTHNWPYGSGNDYSPAISNRFPGYIRT
jgi:hypothetical protein